MFENMILTIETVDSICPRGICPLWRAAGLCGERKALWRESDTVPGAGMDA